MTFAIRFISSTLLVFLIASLSYADERSTNQFISALADLLERKVIGDDELALLIAAADEGRVPNPISEGKADVSVEHFVSRQMLQDYVDIEDLDAEMISAWAGEHLVEQKRQRKNREETRGETALPWDEPALTVLSVGGIHSCAVKLDGTVTCWGDNSQGQITPPPDLGTVKAVSAGASHTCAIKADSTVECWGYRYAKKTPPQNLGVKAISAGHSHACAIKADNSAECWGDSENNYGQYTPPHNLGKVQAISAGDYDTCAIKADSTVKCWGSGNASRKFPQKLGTVRAISVGAAHACAIKTNGTVECWGSDAGGQCSLPTNLGPVRFIAAGEWHTCVVKQDDTVDCWGSGPKFPPQNLGRVKTISSGSSHVCAVKAGGTVKCWGSDSEGQSSPPPDLLLRVVEK